MRTALLALASETVKRVTQTQLRRMFYVRITKNTTKIVELVLEFFREKLYNKLNKKSA